MGKFFTALKRGFHAMGEAPSGERYTAGLTFFNLDWANRSAATLTCTSCGRIEWFLADPEEGG